MERKAHIDPAGAAMLTGFALLLAVNQVVIKLTNDGIQPVFQAGLRSVIAICAVLLWMRWRGIAVRVLPGTALVGIGSGLVFAAEFVCLFMALDLTTVARSVILFYSMPVWLAVIGHFVLPGERLTPVRSLGLACALGGVALALADREGGQASLEGDLLAIGAAICWAGIPLFSRGTKLREERPEMQLVWHLGVSGPVLLLVSLWFGEWWRAPEAVHFAGLAFQGLVIAGAGFTFWIWLLGKYPANGVASFSFLSPVAGVLLGWGLLGEALAPTIWVSVALVAAGIVLINRRR